MQQHWVPASRALSFMARELGGEYPAILAICERAHAGLLRTHAQLYIAPDQRLERATVPSEFWWAEGEEALDQDWTRGDFSTWIDQKYELKAFGVEFDFDGLRRMVAPERGVLAMREFSVSGDPNWLTAREARRQLYESNFTSPTTAHAVLLDYCRLGLVAARALRMEQTITYLRQRDEEREEREWDVPDWFWREFTQSGSSVQDWERGLFSGRGRAPEGNSLIKLSGLHFFGPSLPQAEMPPTNPTEQMPKDRRGRPSKAWWDDFWCAVWGQIYRGELIPSNQADLEKAMSDWIAANGHEASESTVRSVARKLFAEFSK